MVSRRKGSSRHKIGQRAASSRRSGDGRLSSISTASRSSRQLTSRASAEPSRRLAEDQETLAGATNSVCSNNEYIGDGEDDTLSEIVMAVELTPRGTIGCSYYVARYETLYLMEDLQYGDVDAVDTLRLYIDPTVVLVSTKIDDAVVERFDPEARTDGLTSRDNDQFRLPFLLEVRPHNDFAYEAGKSKIVNLNLGHDSYEAPRFNVPGELSTIDLSTDENIVGQQGQLLRLGGSVDLESRNTIGCAGALISYLQRRRAAAYLPGDDAAYLMFRISNLEMFSLRDTMFVNTDTLHSLQILDAESHPNSHNRGPTKSNSGAKEGLSIYGLFHHLAKTPQGRVLLRQRFLRPTLDLNIINERQGAVSTFLQPENEQSMNALIGNLKSVGNMRVMLLNLKKGSSGTTKGKGGFSRNVWSAIRSFAFHALKIKDALQELNGGERLVIRNKIFERFEGYHLAQVGRKISETVDFERSVEESRTVILPGIDEELDRMKRTLDGLEDFLNPVAKKLSEEMPSNLRSTLNVIYFPQIGFLVTVPINPGTGVAMFEGNFDNPWERMFSTEEQVYFKNAQMHEMDDHFGDVYGIIADREIEISHELAQFILKYEELLSSCSDICGELDSLLALAQGARLYSLHRPQMTLENILYVEKGRHLLQEFTVPSFVPNDTFLRGGTGDDAARDSQSANTTTKNPMHDNSTGLENNKLKDAPSMLVLTGPNYSGKSVYLKQVAIIVFMAHVGSFVPAESATIGVTDKILSRVSTRETVSRQQSAFMLDLQQISLALSLSTRRSLLVIDEFGKGTDSSDGAGLAAAVMEYLLSLGPERPKVLGATHFHEIFENGLVQPRSYLAFGHMEVRIDTEASEVSEQITYLYNFRGGRSTSSFGTCCAAMNGVPLELVQRAEELVLLSMRGEDLISACCQMPEEEALELQEAERIARQFLESDAQDRPETMLSNLFVASSSADFDSSHSRMEHICQSSADN